jgi:hypothetical protein
MTYLLLFEWPAQIQVSLRTLPPSLGLQHVLPCCKGFSVVIYCHVLDGNCMVQLMTISVNHINSKLLAINSNKRRAAPRFEPLISGSVGGRATNSATPPLYDSYLLRSCTLTTQIEIPCSKSSLCSRKIRVNISQRFYYQLEIKTCLDFGTGLRKAKDFSDKAAVRLLENQTDSQKPIIWRFRVLNTEPFGIWTFTVLPKM